MPPPLELVLPNSTGRKPPWLMPITGSNGSINKMQPQLSYQCCPTPPPPHQLYPPSHMISTTSFIWMLTGTQFGNCITWNYRVSIQQFSHGELLNHSQWIEGNGKEWRVASRIHQIFRWKKKHQQQQLQQQRIIAQVCPHNVCRTFCHAALELSLNHDYTLVLTNILGFHHYSLF